jgi:hypothetical protein
MMISLDHDACCGLEFLDKIQRYVGEQEAGSVPGMFHMFNRSTVRFGKGNISFLVGSTREGKDMPCFSKNGPRAKVWFWFGIRKELKILIGMQWFSKEEEHMPADKQSGFTCY